MAHRLTKDEIFTKKRTFLLKTLDLKNSMLPEELLKAELINDTQFQHIQVDFN